MLIVNVLWTLELSHIYYFTVITNYGASLDAILVVYFKNKTVFWRLVKCCFPLRGNRDRIASRDFLPTWFFNWSSRFWNPFVLGSLYSMESSRGWLFTYACPNVFTPERFWGIKSTENKIHGMNKSYNNWLIKSGLLSSRLTFGYSNLRFCPHQILIVVCLLHWVQKCPLPSRTFWLPGFLIQPVIYDRFLMEIGPENTTIIICFCQT